MDVQMGDKAVAQQTDAGSATQVPALVQPRAQRQMIVVENAIPVLDTAMFEHMQRIATIMAKSALVPAHLNRGFKSGGQWVNVSPEEAVANCFLVVNQAVKWRMDPFAVAQGVFVTSGKVGYEGKLVAAVINTHPQLERRLSYTYDGTGPKRRVVVSGKIRGDDEIKMVDGTVEQWRTDNGAWQKQPDQMLSYRGAREWARRHMPEAIMGVYSDDEIEQLEREHDPHPNRPATLSVNEGQPEPATRTDKLAADLAKRVRREEAAEDVDPETGEITKAEKAAVTPESVRAAIDAATTQDQLFQYMQDAMKIAASPERDLLMKHWNARVLELKKRDEPDQGATETLPAQGQGEPAVAREPAATPSATAPTAPAPGPQDIDAAEAAKLQKVTAELKACKDTDALDVVMDRIVSENGWRPRSKITLQGVYRERRKEMSE